MKRQDLELRSAQSKKKNVWPYMKRMVPGITSHLKFHEERGNDNLKRLWKWHGM